MNAIDRKIEDIKEHIYWMCENWTEAHKEELGLTCDDGWIDNGWMDELLREDDADWFDLEECKNEMRRFTVKDLVDNLHMWGLIDCEREHDPVNEDGYPSDFLVPYVKNAIKEEHGTDWDEREMDEVDGLTEYFEKIGLL